MANSLYHGSGTTQSPWMSSLESSRPAVNENATVDVCIVGAGIAGLSCAYTLAKAGKSVIVLEAGEIACGETERTTAHLTAVLDSQFSELKRFFGLDGMRLAGESHSAAIDYIEKIVKDEGDNCDFERLDGYLYAPKGESLDSELACARAIKALVVERVDAPPVQLWEGGTCLRFSNQGQIHPIKYVNLLIKAIEKYGGKIYCHSRVTELKGGKDCHAKTANGITIHARAVVVATNMPVNDRVIIATKQAPYRTYVVAIKVAPGSIPKALYWDTLEAYHYVRLSHDGDLLIVGGEDHKTGQQKDPGVCFQKIENWARARFACEEVSFRWSGQVIEPYDCLAYCGRNPIDFDNVYIHTGSSGNGITNGAIAGMLIPDLILGRKNPWEKLYNPARKTLTAANFYVEENLNVAAQYLQWVMPNEKISVDEIEPGCGAIIRNGMAPEAVYRDEEGKLHRLCGTCPHLGGIVKWNQVEKTWDCPCHGSRFKTNGDVVSGPANGPLKPVE